MRIIRTIAELRAEVEAQRRASDRRAHNGPAAQSGSAVRVGFVPTMGALHEGHLSLVRAARADNEVVVLSIFVNPTQFTDAADLAAYPRTEARDVELAAAAGVDIVFAPAATEMYPRGFATSVQVRGAITETLEGAARGAAHFDGMATVVTKLLLAVAPDVAYFGAKDAQQVVVVRRVVADLNLPVRIVAVPTSRDDDGLARSSRNAHLSAAERTQALALSRALRAAEAAMTAGVTDAAVVRDRALDVLAEAGIALEYLAVVDPDTLEPVSQIDAAVLVALAARVGSTRLIDNVVITPASPAPVEGA